MVDQRPRTAPGVLAVALLTGTPSALIASETATAVVLPASGSSPSSESAPHGHAATQVEVTGRDVADYDRLLGTHVGTSDELAEVA